MWDEVVAYTGRPTLYRANPFPQKYDPSCPQRIWVPANTSFLGLTRPFTQNGISHESAVFPEHMIVTNGRRERTRNSACTN